MSSSIETERLILKNSDPELAAAILDYYTRNRIFFETAEPKRNDNYFTYEYQHRVQEIEAARMEKGISAYYYLTLKEDPDRIIGSISFANIRNTPYYSTIFGYDLDEKMQGKGYATESCWAAIDDILSKKTIHRIEARVLPDNIKSIHVLERLGFEYEGLERSSILLQGAFKDHLRYSYIHEIKL